MWRQEGVCGRGRRGQERDEKGRVKLRFCAITCCPTDTKLMISSHSQILDTTANYEQSCDPPEAIKPRFVDNKYSIQQSSLPVNSSFNLISQSCCGDFDFDEIIRFYFDSLPWKVRCGLFFLVHWIIMYTVGR